MSVDRDMLDRWRAEDPRVGVRERFLTPEVDGGKRWPSSRTIGGGRTDGMAHLPLVRSRTDNLQSFEVQLARRLAASGTAGPAVPLAGLWGQRAPMEHSTLIARAKRRRRRRAAEGEGVFPGSV